MDQKRTARIIKARKEIAQHRASIHVLEKVIEFDARNCDHKNSDGTSAIQQVMCDCGNIRKVNICQICDKLIKDVEG